MNAQEIMARFAELDVKADTLTENEQEEADKLAPMVEQIETHGEDVYDAAVDVFGAEYAAENLENGAYEGVYCTTGEFIAEQLLDNLLGDAVDNIPRHWLDLDAIWHDLQSGGEYTDVEFGRGVYIFSMNR